MDFKVQHMSDTIPDEPNDYYEPVHDFETLTGKKPSSEYFEVTPENLHYFVMEDPPDQPDEDEEPVRELSDLLQPRIP